MISPLVLPKDFEISDEFRRCFDIIEHTQASVYISGAAGSGKSSFLTFFRQNSRKNMAVVTPTGIAAVTIQGQTTHSLFKFPYTMIRKEGIKRLWESGLFETLESIV